jgi:peptide-methionine (S)-S-oxide reductase
LAYVAGGCFWCVEADFEKIPGVIGVVSGYTGGQTENPTYKEVVKGGTGHFEAVKIIYDKDIINYRQIMDTFWRTVDPTDKQGQFCDRGQSYQTAIFVTNMAEKEIASHSKILAQQILGKEIVTPILNFSKFFDAEDYHQDYYKGENLIFTRFGLVKQSKAYKYYRKGCGRDARLKILWGSAAIIAVD